MTLANKQLPALYNGVSQQPTTVRLPSQAEEQINCLGTVIDGVRKRPPTRFVAKLTSGSLDGAFIHEINRDITERYTVVLTNGDLKVYGSDGSAKTVAFPYGKDYLTAALPKEQFACITVADYTFVVNKTSVVTMDDAGDDTVVDPTDYWWLNRVAREGDGLGGTISYVLRQALQQQYLANTPGGTFRGVRQSLQDLPETPIEGDIYQIQGTTESAFVSYYVRRNGGVWDECVAPNLKNKITATTMPHALVRKADGTFEFGPFSWAVRVVGDEQTNRNPSFIGRAIRDVFFYKNRLGMCVDENLVLSRAGDFGNFYRLTVLDLLDDEVVDVGASETKVTKLSFAVPLNSDMMAFSDQVQFRVNHGDVVRPGSVSLDVSTQFVMKTTVRPEPIGTDVYFVAEKDQYATILEYFVDDKENNHDAADITAHVPRYIPAGVHRLAGSATHDMLFVLTDGAQARIYVYKFYWTEDEKKAQSSWSYWELSPGVKVLSAVVQSDELVLVTQRSDGAYLERMRLDTGAQVSDLPMQIYLDLQASVQGTYLPVENKTQFDLPFAPVQSKFRLVRGGGFTGMAGAMVPADTFEWVDANTVKVVGDYSAGPCWAGEVYEARYTFSAQYPKDSQDTPILGARMTINSYTIYFVDTAYFKTEVAPYGVEAGVESVVPSHFSEFDGKTLGESYLTLGTPVFKTDKYRFGVFGEASKARVSLVNDTPYASTWQSAEYEANINVRSRTV